MNREKTLLKSVTDNSSSKRHFWSLFSHWRFEAMIPFN